MNLLFLDTETTGLDHEYNDMIQLAGILDINKVQVNNFNYFAKPRSISNIDFRALAINQIPIDKLTGFDEIGIQLTRLRKILEPHINDTKIILAGYNIAFDKDFLKIAWNRFFKDNSFDLIFGHWLMDIWPILAIKHGHINLQEACKIYDVSLTRAHNAWDDISATYAIYNKLV